MWAGELRHRRCRPARPAPLADATTHPPWARAPGPDHPGREPLAGVGRGGKARWPARPGVRRATPPEEDPGDVAFHQLPHHAQPGTDPPVAQIPGEQVQHPPMPGSQVGDRGPPRADASIRHRVVRWQRRKPGPDSGSLSRSRNTGAARRGVATARVRPQPGQTLSGRLSAPGSPSRSGRRRRPPRRRPGGIIGSGTAVRRCSRSAHSRRTRSRRGVASLRGINDPRRGRSGSSARGRTARSALPRPPPAPRNAGPVAPNFIRRARRSVTIGCVNPRLDALTVTHGRHRSRVRSVRAGPATGSRTGPFPAPWTATAPQGGRALPKGGTCRQRIPPGRSSP